MYIYKNIHMYIWITQGIMVPRFCSYKLAFRSIISGKKPTRVRSAQELCVYKSIMGF